MKKLLLLDIDYTLVDGDTPRPYLREFLEYADGKYDLALYTAGTHLRVTSFLRVLRWQLGMDGDFARRLQRSALTRENCPMIEIKSGATVKCLEKASQILKVSLENLMLLDDNPSYDNPHSDKVIQAEGWVKDMENDDYLLRLQNIL